MATAAVKVDDEELVRGVLAHLEMPEGVRLKRIEKIVDSTGTPALRISFAVSKRVPPTPKRIAQLSRMRRSLEEELFALQIEKWPYVHFLETK